MKEKFKKNFFIFFISIVTVAVITGYLTWNKPHKNVIDADAIKVTAIDLFKIFTSDSATGKSKYFLNSVVAVTGEVKEILHNQQNQQIILLKTNTPGYSDF